MEISNIWHDHIKSKTLDEVIGYACDVQKLVDEIKANVETKLSDEELRNACIYFIQIANNILASVAKNKTLDLKPDEMREFMPYMNSECDAIYFTDKEAKQLNETLQSHPNAKNFALLDDHFVLNRHNIETIYELMGKQFDKNAKELKFFQQFFCQLRDDLSDGDYTYFFDKQGQPQNDELLSDWFNYIFSTDYSGKIPITHDQLWPFIRVVDRDTKLKIFKKADISETDDIDLNKINWHDFFKAVQIYNRQNSKHPVLFDLHSYQNRRIILNLRFEQAFNYRNMFINKFAGATEKAFSTGSKAMIALGQATKTMQVLSVFADILLKAAVFIKSFLIAPFFFVVFLLAGGKGHIDKRKEEQQQHKHFLLNAVRINELTKQVAKWSDELAEINQIHFDGKLDIVKRLTANDSKSDFVNKILSQYRSEINKPLKSRVNSKLRKAKINFERFKNIVAPFLGPTLAGILTAAGIFVIGMFFWHYLPFLIALGAFATFIGGLIVLFRVKTDRHEKGVRDILDQSTTRINDLNYYLDKQIKLKDHLLQIVAKKQTPSSQQITLMTIDSENNSQPFQIKVNEKNTSADKLKLENISLKQQVAQLTRERNKLMRQVQQQTDTITYEPLTQDHSNSMSSVF